MGSTMAKVRSWCDGNTIVPEGSALGTPGVSLQKMNQKQGPEKGENGGEDIPIPGAARAEA